MLVPKLRELLPLLLVVAAAVPPPSVRVDPAGMEEVAAVVAALLAAAKPNPPKPSGKEWVNLYAHRDLLSIEKLFFLSAGYRIWFGNEPDA